MISHATLIRHALAALVLLAGATAARAQDEATAPRPRQPAVQLYATGGLSIHQNPLTTKFAEVLDVDGRIGVPIAYGIQPWIGGALAHLRPTCDAGQTQTCSNSESRLLGGLIYTPGIGGDDRGRGGAYFGAGLGTQSSGGQRNLAYSIVIGLPLGGSRLAPLIELRAEKHQTVGDLLMISGGFKAGL